METYIVYLFKTYTMYNTVNINEASNVTEIILMAGHIMCTKQILLHQICLQVFW